MELDEEYHKRKLQEYLELKRSGKLAEIKEQQRNAPYRVYFDEDGIICAFTNSLEFVPNSEWLTYDFSEDQLKVLHDNNVNSYRVVEDDDHDGIYTIQLYKREPKATVAEADFLTEVIEVEDNDPVIECALTHKEFSVKLKKKLKKNKINPATIMHFYLTAKNDPHWLYEYISVSIGELMEHERVYMDINDSNCSVYTKKIFDEYTLVRK